MSQLLRTLNVTVRDVRPEGVVPVRLSKILSAFNQTGVRYPIVFLGGLPLGLNVNDRVPDVNMIIAVKSLMDHRSDERRGTVDE